MAASLMAHVSLDFLGESPDEKVTLGAQIQSNIANNPTIFTSALMHITPAQLLGVNNTLVAANAAALHGSTNSKDDRDAAEEVWDNAFRTAANDVSHIAGGNVTIITLAGFTPTASTRKNKERAGDASFKTPPAGTPGGVSFKMNKATEASAYVYIVGPEGSTLQFQANGATVVTLSSGEKVVVMASTQREVNIVGLAPDTKVVAGARAINAAGAGGGASATLRTGE